MKKLLIGCSAILLATAVYATETGTQSQLYITERDDYHVSYGERDTDSPLVRLSVNGAGRFGQKVKWSQGDDKLALYSAGADIQFNLLPMNEAPFNLWLGFGYSYTPEQEALDYREYYPGTDWRETYYGTIDLKGHDFRLMLIPEWQICDSFAAGLRLGAALTKYDAEIKDHYIYSDEYGPDIRDFDVYTWDDSAVQGIVGLQLTWLPIPHLGIQAYCEARIGEEMEVTIAGEKFATFDSTAVEAGIAIVGQF
jgi:hypothetical protein